MLSHHVLSECLDMLTSLIKEYSVRYLVTIGQDISSFWLDSALLNVHKFF